MIQRSFIVIIILILGLIVINAKGKDRDDKGNNKGDNNGKNNDRGFYDRDNKGSKDYNRDRKPIYDSKEYLSSCINLTDDSTKSVKDMIKGIKRKADKNFVYEDFKKIKGYMKELNDETNALFDSLTDDEKKLITEQENNIKIIRKRIDEILTGCENDLNKTNLKYEELYNNVKKIDDEINKINRQYRAMQWLLVNEQ